MKTVKFNHPEFRGVAVRSHSFSDSVNPPERVKFNNPSNDPNVPTTQGTVLRFCTERGNENLVEVLWDDDVVGYHPVEVLENC